MFMFMFIVIPAPRSVVCIDSNPYSSGTINHGVHVTGMHAFKDGIRYLLSELVHDKVP